MTSHLSKYLSFNLYLDNYYTTLPLVATPCKKGIGACGTSCTSSKDFSPELIIPKNALSKLNFHYRAGVVTRGITTMLWIDNAPVSLMTSIHQLKGRKSEVLKEQHKPGPKSSNAAGVKKAMVFSEGVWKTLLDIPVCINDYNHHMGGVDIAEQYRSYYDTQLMSRRTWFPIFICCTDTALINAFIIFSDLGLVLKHKVFRLPVTWGLILQSLVTRRKKRKFSEENEEDNTTENSGPSKTLYINETQGLPASHYGNMHLPE